MKIGKIKIKKVNNYETTVPIVINDIIVRMESDTEADVNVMDESQYKALKRKIFDDITIEGSNTKLSTLQNELHVSGEFKITARNQSRGTETTFILVKGRINSTPLLGRRALFDLGMLETRADGSLKETNELRRTYCKVVKSVLDSRARSDIEKILKHHDEVFQGIGKIYDKKNNEEFLVKFSMKQDVNPVAQKPRSVPYCLQEPLRKWLGECINEDIFE